VSVDGFHLGGDAASVTAKDDYSVGIAQGVVANAGGSIYIKREARDCTLRAGEAVWAGDASIVGGTMWCVRGVEAAHLGNQAGLTTVVELRNELEVTKEYRDLTDNIKKHEAAIAALELHIGPYLKNRGRVPLLRTPFRLKMTSLLDRYDGVVASLGKLHERERAMRESKPILEEARVNVRQQIHAGVVLMSNDLRLELKESFDGPMSFRRSAGVGEWKQGRYQKLTREECYDKR
jgi:hypothetical protein